MLAAGAGPRLPVAIRIALRDLVRYRARSGAALAATTFAVFLAMLICVVASIKAENPLNWMGPNLSSSQLIVYVQPQIGGGGPVKQLSNAQLASLGRQVDSYAAGVHAQPVLPLDMASASLVQMGTQQHNNFAGPPVNDVAHFTGTCTSPPRNCSPCPASRPARSARAPTSLPCDLAWPACRTCR